MMTKHLFPTTTYHYNSGGEPSDIPDLSYQQLLKFYQSHYHPSNAVFMTFGDIPAAGTMPLSYRWLFPDLNDSTSTSR